jgi:hypothetical protein
VRQRGELEDMCAYQNQHTGVGCRGGALHTTADWDSR